jgi:hypothetical protein
VAAEENSLMVRRVSEELVRQGHEVTLFANGDSQTNAILRAPCDRALRLCPNFEDPLAYHLISLNRVACSADAFAISTLTTSHFPLFAQRSRKTLTTMHGRLDLPDPSARFPRVRDDAIGVDLKRAACGHDLGKLVWHGVPGAAAESVRDGLR